jgi:hypothetical protein
MKKFILGIIVYSVLTVHSLGQSYGEVAIGFKSEKNCEPFDSQMGAMALADPR